MAYFHKCVSFKTTRLQSAISILNDVPDSVLAWGLDDIVCSGNANSSECDTLETKHNAFWLVCNKRKIWRQTGYNECFILGKCVNPISDYRDECSCDSPQLLPQRKQTLSYFMYNFRALLSSTWTEFKHVRLCFLRSAAGPPLSSGRNRCRLQPCRLGPYVPSDGCTTPHPDTDQRQKNIQQKKKWTI